MNFKEFLDFSVDISFLAIIKPSLKKPDLDHVG